MFKKLNAYLLERPKLLLTLLWIFFALAVGIGIYLIVFYPYMGILPFWGCIIVPAVCAFYLRMLYGKIREKKNDNAHDERYRRREERNKQRHPHKKKK